MLHGLRVLNTPEITCAAQSRTASDITIHQRTMFTEECTSSILPAMSRTPGLSWLFMDVPSLSGNIIEDSFLRAQDQHRQAKKNIHRFLMKDHIVLLHVRCYARTSVVLS